MKHRHVLYSFVCTTAITFLKNNKEHGIGVTSIHAEGCSNRVYLTDAGQSMHPFTVDTCLTKPKQLYINAV